MSSNAMFNQSQTTKTSLKVNFGSVTCTDILGSTIKDGDYFTPIGLDNCIHCKCVSGLPKSCVTASCAKPSCVNYQQIPGKCCEYKCPSALPISDAKELAIILSLGIAFLVILILIIVVWRKTRKFKRYSNDAETQRMRTDSDQTDSTPNNQRQLVQLNPTSSQHNQELITSLPPPYAPPKKIDPEAILPFEPPPPYTPHDDNVYGTVV